ncbi:MAG: tyrosine-type recombinase/integrase [Gemella sp.]|nr:tyrosine-type recombinase/integrase [Gemella sp.]
MSTRVIEKFHSYLENKNLSKNTIDSYMLDINKINKYSVKKILENFTTNTDDVNSYLFMLKQKGYSITTILRSLSTINVFNKFLFDEKMIGHTIKMELPFDKKSEANEEFVIFTRKEVAEILNFESEDILSLRDRAIFELVYAIGIKPTDCIALNRENCNFNIGYLKYKKDNIFHTIPLNRETLDAISKYLEALEKQGIKHEKLFLSSKKEALSRQGFWKIFKKRQADLGYKKDLSPTTFRNSLAIHLLEDGIAVEDVKELLGLKSINALKPYLERLESKNISRILQNHPRNKIR